MKTKTLRKKIKASVRAHYVRKKDYDQLKDQVKDLKRRLARMLHEGGPVLAGIR